MVFTWNDESDPLGDILAFIEGIEASIGLLGSKTPIGRTHFERLWAEYVEANDYTLEEIDAKKKEQESYFDIYENA